MDVLEIDAASNRGIDDIRELKDEVRYNPARDRNKIFIIDEVHMLTTEAFNALLKTLEEPPPNVVFILATTEYHKVPATILSRCQKYTFKLIPYPMILNRLREIAQAEEIHISDGALEQVAFASGGSMRDAMSSLDQVLAFSGNEVRDEDVATLLGLVETTVLGQTVHAIAGNDTAMLLRIVANLVEAGQDLHNFCRRLSGQFRNLMVLKSGVTDTALLGVPESLLPELRTQAELFSREDLIRLFDTFQKIETAMKFATQVRFQLEMGLIELAHVARLRPIEDLIAEFSGFAGDGLEVRNSQQQKSNLQTPTGTARFSQTQPSGKPGFSKPAPMPQPVRSYSTPPSKTRETPSSPPPPPPVEELEAAHHAPMSVPAQATTEAPHPASTSSGGSDDLLSRIARAVERESLRSLIQSLAGAKLEENRVILTLGAANDFTRDRVGQNLKEIAKAASSVLERQVAAIIADATGTSSSYPNSATVQKSATTPRSAPAPESSDKPESKPQSKDDELLEKAKQDPVVRSFFDNFPGPVSIEKIDK